MRRVSSPERKNRRPAVVQRHIGVSLSGAKSDRSCLVVLDYFVAEKRMVVSGLFDRIKAEEFISADLKIIELIHQFSDNCVAVNFDAPLTLPVCLTCRLKCPGAEECSVDSVKWMRDLYFSQEKKRPKKFFSPYTQRAVDFYLSELEEENLEIHHALGGNLAPLTARAVFLKRRLTLPIFEVSTRLSGWRLGNLWGVNRSQLRSLRSSVGGDIARKAMINALVEREGLFVYEQDQRALLENFNAFDALLCAVVSALRTLNRVELEPAQFPKNEIWPLFPKV